MSVEVETKLGRSGPEAQGVSSEAILRFVKAVEEKKLGLHSLMLLRHGQVVAEGWWAPYARDERHMLFSLSKSFTSTAAGLAIGEGYFSLDDKVVSFFPEECPDEISANLATMRVRDLLSMSTGHETDTTGPMHRSPEGGWEKIFLAHPVEHKPGTHFVYNSGATYMVSSIVQKTTGMKVIDYLTPLLFKPLGISCPIWEENAQGVNVGGWGLNITTEDIARFGQLYLQDGVWQGKRLLPEGWVAEATQSHISNGTDPNSDWAQGYGFQFWRSRHGTYRGDGAFGQFCFVLPEQDSVLAVTSGTDDMQGIMNAVWDHLLKGFKAGPLAPDSASAGRLKEKIGGLAMSGPEGKQTSKIAAQVSGRVWTFDTTIEGLESALWAGEGMNSRLESARWTFDDDGCVLTVRDERGEHRIAAGSGSWRSGETSFWRGGKVVARGAWVDEERYRIEVFFTSGPYSKIITGRFSGDGVEMRVTQNVAFGAKEWPVLVGSAT